MTKKYLNIAILPARIGSKRIKKKNIKFFNGKPILAWTFQILVKSKLFDKIIISSESDIVLKVAKKVGFREAIKRPKRLADNFTETKEVIKHAIKELEKKYDLNNICCVYPCNPFIKIKDLKKEFSILKKKNNAFIFPISRYTHPIERALFYKDSKLNYINKKYQNTRTQDLKPKFYDVGQFYLAKKEIWTNLKKRKNVGVEISPYGCMDIDTMDDWNYAEILHKKMRFK